MFSNSILTNQNISIGEIFLFLWISTSILYFSLYLWYENYHIKTCIKKIKEKPNFNNIIILITIFVFDFYLILIFSNIDTTREWVDAIGLPVTTFIVAFFINARQKAREAIQNETNRNKETLKNYLTEMRNLLIDKDVEKINKDDPVAKLCEAFTVTTLYELDSGRNKIVTNFLSEMNLTKINSNQWAIFNQAYLKEANLEGALLREAELCEADLEKANLKGANLENANLEDANLKRANLSYAHLSKANLSGAHLEKANLRYTDLQNANTVNEASYTEYRTGLRTLFPEDFNPEEYGMKNADDT